MEEARLFSWRSPLARIWRENSARGQNHYSKSVSETFINTGAQISNNVSRGSQLSKTMPQAQYIP